MSTKLGIENLLSSVSTIESKPATADEGLIIRRVIEKAEGNWNLRNDNTETLVTKEFEADDLRIAAEQIGLSGNEAVTAFIEVAFGEESGESVTISRDDVGTLNLDEVK